MADVSTLHLTAVNSDKRAVAITAVKAALVAAGGAADDAQLWREAQQAVFYVLRDEGPVGLINADPDIVDAALAAFRAVVGDSDAAKVERDMDEAPYARAPGPITITLRSPGPEPELDTRESIDASFLAPTPADFAPTYAAARSALLLMQMTNGKPIPAWFYAKQLANSTEQVEHWVQVGNLIIETFGFAKEAPDDV